MTPEQEYEYNYNLTSNEEKYLLQDVLMNMYFDLLRSETFKKDSNIFTDLTTPSYSNTFEREMATKDLDCWDFIPSREKKEWKMRFPKGCDFRNYCNLDIPYQNSHEFTSYEALESYNLIVEATILIPHLLESRDGRAKVAKYFSELQEVKPIHKQTVKIVLCNLFYSYAFEIFHIFANHHRKLAELKEDFFHMPYSEEDLNRRLRSKKIPRIETSFLAAETRGRSIIDGYEDGWLGPIHTIWYLADLCGDISTGFLQPEIENPRYGLLFTKEFLFAALNFPVYIPGFTSKENLYFNPLLLPDFVDYKFSPYSDRRKYDYYSLDKPVTATVMRILSQFICPLGTFPIPKKLLKQLGKNFKSVKPIQPAFRELVLDYLGYR